MYNKESEYMIQDKILNNAYNTGEIDHQAFTQTIKIDAKVIGQYKENTSDNIIGVRTQKMLEDQMYLHFKNSEFFEKYKVPKRVDKSDMIKMYYFFKGFLIKERTFSNIEIFIGFAEFFQINYDQLYTEIGVRDKEEILHELHDSKSLKNKIKTKKLF